MENGIAAGYFGYSGYSGYSGNNPLPAASHQIGFSAMLQPQRKRNASNYVDYAFYWKHHVERVVSLLNGNGTFPDCPDEPQFVQEAHLDTGSDDVPPEDHTVEAPTDFWGLKSQSVRDLWKDVEAPYYKCEERTTDERKKKYEEVTTVESKSGPIANSERDRYAANMATGFFPSYDPRQTGGRNPWSWNHNREFPRNERNAGGDVCVEIPSSLISEDEVPSSPRRAQRPLNTYVYSRSRTYQVENHTTRYEETELRKGKGMPPPVKVKLVNIEDTQIFPPLMLDVVETNKNNKDVAAKKKKKKKKVTTETTDNEDVAIEANNNHDISNFNLGKFNV